jgi:hypothetical protein
MSPIRDYGWKAAGPREAFLSLMQRRSRITARSDQASPTHVPTAGGPQEREERSAYSWRVATNDWPWSDGRASVLCLIVKHEQRWRSKSSVPPAGQAERELRDLASLCSGRSLTGVRLASRGPADPQEIGPTVSRHGYEIIELFVTQLFPLPLHSG